jgi:ribosome biogenesis GTPase
MLETVLPRRTALARAGADGSSRGQLLAANVDTVLIAVSLDVPLRHTRTERLLSLAWESGARPVVALTKADMHPDPQAARDEVADVALGVEVLLTSAETGEGIDELRAVLEGTIVLLGPSGVGKSMLGNRLLGADLLTTGAVRTGDGKGRHTTAWRELLPLPGGGVLLDTPGLRSIGLTGSDEGLSQTFADLENLAAQCRFSDCEHRADPGCAVLAAVADGTLEERRLESYRKLQRETAWMASRTDARARTDRTARAKSMTKHLRATYRGPEASR